MKRLCHAISFALLLSGCGGGSSSNSNNVMPQGGNIRQTSVQRAVSAQALQTLQAFSMANSFGASYVMSVARRPEVRRLASHWRAGAPHPFAHGARRNVTYGACNNGVETATVVISPQEVQYYTLTFYDAACTTLFQNIFIDIAANSPGSEVGTGNVTQYDTTNDVVAFDTIALNVANSPGSAQVSLQITSAPDSASPPTATIGIECTLTGGSSSQSCHLGSIQNVESLGKDYGLVANLSETLAAPTVTFSGTGTGYLGGLNSLVMGQTPSGTWTITGGAQENTFTMNGSLSAQAQGSAVTGNLTLVDSADNGTVSVTVGSSGVNGSVVQTSTGATMASFTTDLNGNGTMTYSNGTTVAIVDWIIVA